MAPAAAGVVTDACRHECRCRCRAVSHSHTADVGRPEGVQQLRVGDILTQVPHKDGVQGVGLLTVLGLRCPVDAHDLAA